MYITRVRVQGLADLPAFELGEIERFVHLRGPDPASTALGDGIALAFAALAEKPLRALLLAWELLEGDDEVEILSDPFPTQATWSRGGLARRLVADPNRRSLTTTLDIALDPVLFRELRDEAARDPRLVTALAAGPTLSLTTGALFARSYDALALSIQSLSIGGERFPVLPRERPPWLTKLLQQIGGRFHRHHTDPLFTWRVLDASTSLDGHDRYRAWQRALELSFGSVRVARSDTEQPLLLAEERPLRRWGERGWRKAGLLASVHLSGADVLWAESDETALEQALEDGVLEQAWRVSPDGTIAVQPQPAEPPQQAARFPARASGGGDA